MGSVEVVVGLAEVGQGLGPPGFGVKCGAFERGIIV